MLRRAVAVAPLSVLLLLGSAAAATAGGSDAPTPYTVTADGLTLPAGRTFVENDHVNVRYVVDGVTLSAQLHVQAATAQGALAGRSEVRWSELGLPAERCVTWVQVSGFNEHFGEGGQRPVCSAAPPAQTAVPVAPLAPVPATPVTPSAAPASPPASAVTPAPAAPAAPAPAVTAAAVPVPSPTVSGAVLAATPGPTSTTAPTVRAQVLADGPRPGGVLATTGGTLVPLLGLATAALVAGLVRRVARRRPARAAGARPAHRR
jgi:hypothetical protein